MVAPSNLPYFALAVLLGVACDAPAGMVTPDSASVRPSRGTIPLGSVGLTEHYEMTASVPEECSTMVALRDGVTRLGIEIAISARGEVQVPANPYYALLVDSEQRVFEATLGGCEPALAPRLLERGQSARGFVIFDVPEQSRGLQLVYAPRLTFEPDRAAPSNRTPAALPSDVVDELVFALGR